MPRNAQLAALKAIYDMLEEICAKQEQGNIALRRITSLLQSIDESLDTVEVE